MRTLLDIALNELRIRFQERGIWVNLVVIPIIISVAVGLGSGVAPNASADGPRLRVDVINEDDGELSQSLLASVQAANTRIILCPMDNDEDDICGFNDASFSPALAQERLENEASLALLEIPAGFSQSVDSGQPASIIYRANEDITAPSYILQAVQAGVQRVSGAQVAVMVANDVAADLPYLQFSDDADHAAFENAVRDEAQTLWASQPVRVEFVQASIEPTEQNSNAGFQQSIPGMASMYVMFTVLPLAAAIILERKQWTLQRLVTLPISRAQILGGKLLSRFVLGMIQYGILFAFGLLIGVRFGHDPVALILLMMAFTFCITALALALTTLLKTSAQAEGITLFMSLTLAPLGGAWWSLDIVPEWMRVVGHISPIAWAMDGFHSLIFYNGDITTIVVPVLVLLAMGAAFFAFGVARFQFD